MEITLRVGRAQARSYDSPPPCFTSGRPGFCGVHGQAIRGIRPIALHQEHGILQPTPESGLRTTGFPVGTLLRVLPHHACSTAAQFDGYHVISDAPGAAPYWPRFRGW